MGKKPISKISKARKKQFPSLVKVLRPKVYITETSSFKSLVQGLTGNGTMPQFQSLSPPPSNEIHTTPSRETGSYYNYVEQTPLEEYNDHRLRELWIDDQEYGSTTSSSTVETTSSSLESWDQQGFMVENVLDDQVLEDLLAVRDIESWLLDF